MPPFEPTIYIIGTGAIGKVLAVLLQGEGKKVILVRATADKLPAASVQLQVELPGGTVSASIPVRTFSDLPALDGLLVICTKSYGNQVLAEKLRDRAGTSPIVILQNGLGVEEAFLAFPQLFRCVLFATSQVMAPDRLRFKPVAVSPIGTVRGDTKTLHLVVQLLNSKRFAFRAEENIQPVTWTKTIVNSVFNTVCTLLETDNGIFCRDNAALEIARRIIAECVAVASLKGMALDPEKILDNLLLISQSSGGQLISTYQDLLQKRPTEIDALNFAIVKIAATINKTDLVRETRLLGELVRIKSAMITV